MAVTGPSNDYGYQPTTYQLIQGAARLISAIQTGETLEDQEYSDALFSLNGMIAAWQAMGIHVWSEVFGTLFLQPGQIQYQLGTGSPDRACLKSAWLETALTATAIAGASAVSVDAVSGSTNGGPVNAILAGDHIGIALDAGTLFWTTVAAAPVGTLVSLAAPLPSQASAGATVIDYTADLVRPLKVPTVTRYVFAAPGGQPIETPCSIYSRIDYQQVPNKTTPGMVTAVFYDPQLTFGLMNVWPAPSTDSNALNFVAQRPLQDFVTQANSADLPIEWSSCIRYNLAVELAPEYDVTPDRLQMLKTLADEKLDICRSWDREPESVYFGVSTYPATRN